jgi:hypothetical protein
MAREDKMIKTKDRKNHIWFTQIFLKDGYMICNVCGCVAEQQYSNPTYVKRIVFETPNSCNAWKRTKNETRALKERAAQPTTAAGVNWKHATVRQTLVEITFWWRRGKMQLKDDVEYVNNWFLNVIDKGSCLYDAWDRIRAALSKTDNNGQKVTSTNKQSVPTYLCAECKERWELAHTKY